MFETVITGKAAQTAGILLKEKRGQAGMTLEALNDKTKIAMGYLSRIETQKAKEIRESQVKKILVALTGADEHAADDLFEAFKSEIMSFSKKKLHGLTWASNN